MPKFVYTAKTEGARTIREEEEASSKEELVAKLRARGLFIVSIKEVSQTRRAGKGATLFSRYFHYKGSRSSIKTYDLAFLARNLSIALSSGVALLRSLEILSFQTESMRLGKILSACGNHIREGLSLSEAVAKYPKVFSPLWKGIIEVGEASGNLPFVLEKLADYLEMRIEFERKIKSALIYPAILVVAALLAIFAFFKFILPKFADLFLQFDVELPAATKFLVNASQFMEKNYLFVLGGLIGLVVGFVFFIRNPASKKIWDNISLKLPILGNLIFLFCLERVTSTIYILLDSGLPLVYALEVVSRGVGNDLFEKDILYVRNKVRDGASLSVEFSKLNLFPPLVSEMAKIGEETGSMPQVFEKISRHYQKELSTRVERLIAAFEPLMIVFMGVVIGSIVISLFLPLFRIAGVTG